MERLTPHQDTQVVQALETIVGLIEADGHSFYMDKGHESLEVLMDDMRAELAPIDTILTATSKDE